MGKPRRPATQTGGRLQAAGALGQFELAQVTPDDLRHRHAQGGGKILLGHAALLGGRLQQLQQVGRHVRHVAGTIEIDRQPFVLRHAAKIFNVGTHDGHAVSAGQMHDAAGPGGRRIGQYGHRSALKQLRNLLLRHVAGELDSGIALVTEGDGSDIARRVGMISPSDHQLGGGKLLPHLAEGVNHRLQALVGSPLAKGQNAAIGIISAGKVGGFRTMGEDSMRPPVHVSGPVFLLQQLAVSGQQDRNRVGQQQHPRCNRAGAPVHAAKMHVRIAQVDRIHQVMEGDMRIVAAQTSEQGRRKTGKSGQGVVAKGAEQQVEPNHIRLQPVQKVQ